MFYETSVATQRICCCAGLACDAQWLGMSSPELTTSDFELIADETLDKMVEALAALEDDGLEADLESGVLSVRFEDGAKFVINSHRAALQIWMAAGTTAWHFDWDGRAWISSKSREELWATVNEKVGAKLGKTLELRS